MSQSSDVPVDSGAELARATGSVGCIRIRNNSDIMEDEEVYLH